MKRLFDLFLAALLTIPFLTLICILAVLIRIESPGSALLLQPRIGRNGAPFRCFKLRTMYDGTPAVPTHEAPSDAVTGLGRFLRASKLDELPQIWNVWRGEMSFVGPRPCLAIQTELIEERQRLGTLALRPGITGIAQAQGIDMSDPYRLAQIEATYLQTQSIAEDIRILASTFLRAGRRGQVKMRA
jgi:O-antigen biosynthesis protein WbqP